MFKRHLLTNPILNYNFNIFHDRKLGERWEIR